MLYWSLVPLAFACSSQCVVVKRQNDGSNPSGTVDPSTIKDCTFWVNVQPDYTCSSIERYYGIPAKNLIGFNPSLKGDCSGLTPGYSYCIEENFGLGPVAPPSPSSPTTAPTSTANATIPNSSSPTSTAHSPVQKGIVSDCRDFYKVADGDGCQEIVDKYGTFSLETFYSWNPAVGATCRGLRADYYVCVGVPSTPTAKPTAASATSSVLGPVQTGIVSDCNQYYQVVSGDGCQAIVDKYGTFTLSDFYAWNPAVGSSCGSLLLGYYVCVGTTSTPVASPTTTTTTQPTTTATAPAPSGPSPTQAGIRSDCTSYYQAASGDTCGVIAAKIGTFTTADFESWNPAVGSTCTTLFAGYYYCVAVPGTPTEPISPPQPDPVPVATGPQPQQPGTFANCKQYYEVVSGDSCYVIEQKLSISENDFNLWNPGVGSDCKGLFLGYYICIGV